MSVSLMLKHKSTGEFREVPIASSRGFDENWRQLSQQLGLHFVPLFSGSALTKVSDELIPEIIRELHLLLETAEADPDSEWIAERARNILNALAETNPTEWEYSFG
jgi:hypothetical protein